MIERMKRSVVWSISTTDFIDLVKKSNSIQDLCRYFKLELKGGNYGTIKRRIRKENVDISHFNRHRHTDFNHISKNQFLSEIHTYQNKPNYWMKKKLLEFNLLKNKCELCELVNFWNDKPLVLQLDHKDGNRKNTALDNFRLLCPNCHSQTETYSMGTRRRVVHLCVDCHNPHSGYRERCVKCGNKIKRKVQRPSKEKLEMLIKNFPRTQIARKYDVSDNSIKKWCINYGIHYNFGRGYWQKIGGWAVT